MQRLNDHQDDDPVNLVDGKVTNDMNKDFKYKLYWYNNLEISITTSKHLKQDAKLLEKYNEWKSDYNDDSWPIYWGSNNEVKERNDNDIFAYLWSLTNQKEEIMKLTLNCSDIYYFNDYLMFKEDCFEASFNYSQK